MKRFLAFSLAIALTALLVAGCGTFWEAPGEKRPWPGVRGYVPGKVPEAELLLTDGDAVPPGVAGLCWHMGGAAAVPVDVAGKLTLFLPSAADVTALCLDYIGDEAGAITLEGELGAHTGAVFDLTALSAPDESGSYNVTATVRLRDRTESYSLRVIASSGLSAIFISSDDPVDRGRAYVDGEKMSPASGSMVMLDENGGIIYSNALDHIKSRGNSTFLYYPKKSYQIKLSQKADLLGISEKQKLWVLLAEYTDATLFRDKLCKDMAGDLGVAGSPDSDWVDLYYDGEYRGTYLLSEKIRVSPRGLDIFDLEAEYEAVNPDYGSSVTVAEGRNAYGNRYQFVEGVTDPEDFTQGYLLEINYQKGSTTNWFMSGRKWGINVNAPENLSSAAMLYISELWQELEDALYTKNGDGEYTGVNPNTGKPYTQYIDVDSFARMYLMYIFSDNQDAYCQSTYYYLADGVFRAGPMWDSDQSFGIMWRKEAEIDSLLNYNYLIEALITFPEFRAAVAEIYFEEFKGLADSYIEGETLAYGARIAPSEKLNRILWPVYYSSSGRMTTYPEGTTYEEVIDHVRAWMRARIGWLDTRFEGWK